MHIQYRSIIRSQITPYAQAQTYPTGWAGRQTGAQLYDDLVEYAANVMKRNGLLPHECPECLQIGFTTLLETLKSQHEFLADKTRQQAVFFILARCKSSSLRAYDRRGAVRWKNTRSPATRMTVTNAGPRGRPTSTPGSTSSASCISWPQNTATRSST